MIMCINTYLFLPLTKLPLMLLAKMSNNYLNIIVTCMLHLISS